jgi:hypothetical protein
MFPNVVLVDGRPESSSSSTDICLSLKRLYHKKVLLWLMALSPKASCSNQWVSAAVFLRLKQNLIQILCSLKSIISFVKKFAGSLKHNLTICTELRNTSSQLHNYWYTDSQSILLATSSDGRPYDKQFRRTV